MFYDALLIKMFFFTFLFFVVDISLVVQLFNVSVFFIPVCRVDIKNIDCIFAIVYLHVLKTNDNVLEFLKYAFAATSV